MIAFDRGDPPGRRRIPLNWGRRRHIGNCYLHISILKPSAWDIAPFHTECSSVTGLLCDVLAANGGSVSAEHASGLLKKPYLSSRRSEAEIALMRGIKQVFDPAGILNPGKLL